MPAINIKCAIKALNRYKPGKNIFTANTYLESCVFCNSRRIKVLSYRTDVCRDCRAVFTFVGTDSSRILNRCSFKVAKPPQSSAYYIIIGMIPEVYGEIEECVT